jgi:hypothetical protein
VLGILVGVLMVLPLLQGPPVVQSFWLIALGALFLGLWPRGVPPAWRTGQAEPWPSSAQARATRMGAARGGRELPKPEPVQDGEPPAARATSTPHPSSKKRKRKRRG